MTSAHPTRIPAEYLVEWRFLPRWVDNTLNVLAPTPPEPHVLDDVWWAFGAKPSVVIVPEPEFTSLFNSALQRESETASDLIAALEPDVAEVQVSDENDIVTQSQQAPVIRLVNLILLEAAEARASDVHLQATRTGLEVRYRIDGTLIAGPSPPAHLASAVVGRLKVMTDLDVAERRRPQDGRVRLRLEDSSLDVRVSTIPTLHGESVVLRFLKAEARGSSFSDLGMDEGTSSKLTMALQRPHGVLLTTGPTGSGKTTTLYAAVTLLRTGREKIITVEDPIEYALEGIAQVPVNRKAGVTFATALRSILRQDPDVILVGEMRDEETADICIQSALTGHLVLSTLHTNDAPSALIRLIDLGIEPYLVTSTVESVLAQRLVRTVCGECAREERVPSYIQVQMETAGFPSQRLRRGIGCNACRGTGYFGRTGVYELLLMDDDIRGVVLERSGSAAIRRLSLDKGMRSLVADGWRQVAAGITTPEEVLRVAR